MMNSTAFLPISLIGFENRRKIQVLILSQSSNLSWSLLMVFNILYDLFFPVLSLNNLTISISYPIVVIIIVFIGLVLFCICRNNNYRDDEIKLNDGAPNLAQILENEEEENSTTLVVAKVVENRRMSNYE